MLYNVTLSLDKREKRVRADTEIIFYSWLKQQRESNGGADNTATVL